MSLARSLPMCCADVADRDVLSSAAAERLPLHDTQPERVVVRGADQAASPDSPPRRRARRSRGSPSSAPRSTACSESTRTLSLRQLVPSVFLAPAVSAALRYVTMSPPRKA